MMLVASFGKMPRFFCCLCPFVSESSSAVPSPDPILLSGPSPADRKQQRKQLLNIREIFSIEPNDRTYFLCQFPISAQLNKTTRLIHGLWRTANRILHETKNSWKERNRPQHVRKTRRWYQFYLNFSTEYLVILSKRHFVTNYFYWFQLRPF